MQGLKNSEWSPDICQMKDTVFQCWGEGLAGGGQFYLGKRINKIEYEGIGICARTEIRQDSDNAGQNVKLFLKVHRTYKLL